MKSALKGTYGLDNSAKLGLYLREWDVMKASMPLDMLEDDKDNFIKV